MLAPEINSYRFGRIVIDGQVHTQDVIILPDQVIGGWWRHEGHSLSVGDLASVFEARPELLIVGQGACSRMSIPAATRLAVTPAGIKLIALPTGEAVELYNALRATRRVAAALHLTC